MKHFLINFMRMGSAVSTPPIRHRMRSVLLVLGLLLGSLNVWGETKDFTIAFNDNNSDASSALTTSTFTAQVSSGSDSIKSIISTSYCYAGTGGLKVSSNNNNGSFKIQLNHSLSITKVVLSVKNKNATTCTVDVGTTSFSTTDALTDANFADMEFTGTETKSDEISIAIGGTANKKRVGYIASITIYHTVSGGGIPEPEVCATPTFTPAAGSYEGTQSVTIESTEGATIYYTTDGSKPSTSSSVYDGGAISVSSDQTIKAYAVKEGLDDSEVAEAAYTITAGPDVTLDFTSNTGWNFPTSKTLSEGSFTNGGYTIKVAGGASGTGYNFDTDHLFFGKKDAYIELPTFDRPIEKIVIVGVSDGSGSVSFNLYQGETPVSTSVTSCKVDQTFEIDAQNQKADVAHFIRLTNDNNARFAKIKIYLGAEPEKYAVTLVAEGGTLTATKGGVAFASGAEVIAGTELELSATPSGTNVNPSSIIVSDGENNVTDQVLVGTTLTVPAYDITVSATFTPTYAISKVADGGSIELEYTAASAPDGRAIAGTEIMATATADANHTFKSLALSNNVTDPEINENVATFTMPAEDVTITATFDENQDPYIALSQTEDYLFDDVAEGALTNMTFTVSGANLGNNLSVSKSGTNADQFNLSVSSISVTDGAVTNAEVTVTPVTSAAGTFGATITVDDGENGAPAQSFDVAITVLPKYTAKWIVNGDTENPYSSQTAIEGTELTFPDAPTPAGDCAGTEFMGWLTAPLAEASADEPEGLIKTYTGHTMPAADVNYYAVFAEETPGEDEIETYSHTIEAKTWSSAGAQTLSSVAWTLANDGNFYNYDGTKGQQVGSGSASASAMSLTTSGISGKITSVKIYTSGAKDVVATVAASVNGVAYKNDNSTSPVAISSTNTGYEFTGSETGEIVISWAQTSSKALYFKQIEVRYAAPGASTYSNYVTTCPHCNSVALEAAYGTNPANGSITLGKSEVKTCEETTVSIENTPATGYVLSTIALSNNITGASVNEAKTQITIPEGAPAGTLTVTATFAAIDYAVTMTQTGGANAELTGAKNNAHYGETINITAEDKEGYQFLGWGATPTVTFADASALSTSFTMPNEAVEVTANYAKLYTISFYVGSSTDAYDEVTTYVGNTIDLSSIGTPTKFADEYPNFIGWSETKFSATNSEPTIVSGTITVSDDDEYYAVFGNALTVETNNYAKVNAIESGKNYLIVAEYGTKLEALHAAVLSKDYWLKSSEVSATNDIIASDNAERKWQITVNAGVANVYNAQNSKYLAVTFASGQYYNAILSANACDLTITANEGAWNISGESNNETIYVIHAATYAEFIGDDEAAPIYLYKQIVNPTEWATYAAENVTISYYDNVDNTNPIHTALVEKGNNTVDLTYEPEARAGYTFIGWSLTTNGNVEASLTNVNENTPLYAIWASNHTTTIKFYAKGSDDPIATHDQTQGLAYDIPDLSASLPVVPQGFTFVGWSASQINNEAAAYTQVTSVTPDVAEADSEMSLYAVYNREVTGSGDYVKVTTARADWSGQYLIVNEENKVAFNGSLAENALPGTSTTVSVSISENTIAQSTSMDNASFTFAQVDGGYSIQSHSGYYIGRNSNSTGMDVTDTYSAAYKNTIGVDEITANNEYLLRYNAANDQKRFRYYSGESVKGIALYRKDDVENNYTTNPVVKYDITYLAGDAENVTGVCDADRQEAGNITLCDAPTSDDKNFAKWSDGTNLYEAGAAYTLSADVTFTATWTPKPTYNVTYNTSGSQGTTPTDAINYYEGDEVTLASASGLSNAGYFFDQWVATYVDNNSETQTLVIEDGKFTMPAFNVTVTATWARKSSDKWIKVTATSQLAADKEYIIVNTDATYAVGAQNNNNRAAAAIEENNGILTISDAVAKFTLGIEDGKYTFYQNGTVDNVDKGYLYAASSSSNYMKTQTSNDANGIWTITLGEEGTATVTATGTNTRNIMRYNPNNGSPVFSCYASNSSVQNPVVLYYKAPKIEINDSESVNVSDAAGSDIVIHDGGTLVVEAAATIGDLTVENGGKVTLSSNKLTVVGTFTIETTMASGESGQLNGATASNFEAGEAYIDITLGAGGTSSQWHAFTVPFPVDALNGVYDLDGNKLTNEVNYAIMDYHGDIRAEGKYGWKKYRGILQPGTFYLMTVDGERTTYRFKKVAGADIVAGNTKQLHKYASSIGNNNNGWNGVGNPTLMYGQVAYKAQVLNPASYTYEAFNENETNFIVGTPFFIQATEDGTMTFAAASGSANYAPAHQASNEIKDVKVTFGNEEFRDKLYISASEDALNEYETGKDLVKMTMTSTPKVAQIFGEAYNAKLCMVNTPMVNDQAEVALSLYAPAAGEYTIAAPEETNAYVYLTKDGVIIWNLSNGEYTADMKQGNNEGYGIRIVKAPNATTGIGNAEAGEAGVQKVVIDNNVYILRGEKMYDATGRMVK